MKAIKQTAALLAVYLLTMAPTIACAVCSGNEDGRTSAYRAMTGVMTLMPFIVIGAFLYWTRARANKKLIEEGKKPKFPNL